MAGLRLEMQLNDCVSWTKLSNFLWLIKKVLCVQNNCNNCVKHIQNVISRSIQMGNEDLSCSVDLFIKMQLIGVLSNGG